MMALPMVAMACCVPVGSLLNAAANFLASCCKVPSLCKVSPTVFMASITAGCEFSAHCISRETRVALCAAESEPGTAAVLAAAAMVLL